MSIKLLFVLTVICMLLAGAATEFGYLALATSLGCVGVLLSIVMLVRYLEQS